MSRREGNGCPLHRCPRIRQGTRAQDRTPSLHRRVQAPAVGAGSEDHAQEFRTRSPLSDHEPVPRSRLIFRTLPRASQPVSRRNPAVIAYQSHVPDRNSRLSEREIQAPISRMTRQDPTLRRPALSFAEMRHVGHETGRRDNDLQERMGALMGFRYDRQHHCERVFRQTKRIYGTCNGKSEPDALQDSQRRPSALDREDRFQIDVVEDAGPGCNEPRKMPSAKVMPAVKAELAGDVDSAAYLDRSLGIISKNAGGNIVLAIRGLNRLEQADAASAFRDSGTGGAGVRSWFLTSRRHMCRILAGTGWPSAGGHRSARLCFTSGANRRVRRRYG